MLYAGTRGLLDVVPVERVKEWQAAFLRAYHSQYGEIADAIEESKVVSDETEPKLRSAIEQFNSTWS